MHARPSAVAAELGRSRARRHALARATTALPEHRHPEPVEGVWAPTC